MNDTAALRGDGHEHGGFGLSVSPEARQRMLSGLFKNVPSAA
jgi:hypothetical protein